MNERVVALLAMPLHEADALGRAAGPVRSPVGVAAARAHAQPARLPHAHASAYVRKRVTCVFDAGAVTSIRCALKLRSIARRETHTPLSALVPETLRAWDSHTADTPPAHLLPFGTNDS